MEILRVPRKLKKRIKKINNCVGRITQGDLSIMFLLYKAHKHPLKWRYIVSDGVEIKGVHDFLLSTD